MIFECKSRNARLGIAVISILISMASIVGVEHSPLRLKQDQLIMNHICLMQILASALLLMGTLKYNEWFFVPWLLTAAAFAYALLYLSLSYWLSLGGDRKLSLNIVCLLYIISGFWFFFIHAVFEDFREMRHSSRNLLALNMPHSNC